VKILVRNLARFTTEKQLLCLFEAHGKVQFCTLVKDRETGKSKGFGFVEMPKPGEAKAAIKAINGTDIDGNRVRVKKAEARPDDHTDKNTSAPDTVQKTEYTSAVSLPATSEEIVSNETPTKDDNNASVKDAKSTKPKPSKEKAAPKQSIWPQD
jgi:RNA recognition motif-containing protein